MANIIRRNRHGVVLSAPPAAVPTDAYQKRSLDRLHVFSNWCAASGVQGHIGEYGVPSDRPTAEQAQWNAFLTNLYTEMRHLGLHGTQWASGKAWNTYNLGLYTDNGTGVLNTARATAAAASPFFTATVGTNLAGNEFSVTSAGYDRSAGYQGVVHNSADFAYAYSQGLRTVRYPVVWERLQPTLNGALDPAHLTDLNTVLQAAYANGMTISLDLHNYARYTTAAANANAGIPMSTAGTVNANHLADLWTKINTYVQADVGRRTAMLAYDLMNEPHDLAPEQSITPNVAGLSYAFDTGVAGWNVEGAAAVTLDTALSHDGAGSASFPYTGTQTRLREGVNASRNLSGNGLAFSVWVYVPPGATGAYSARIFVFPPSYAEVDGGTVPLATGAWTQVTGSFSSAVMSTVTDIGIQINTTSADTQTLHIDTFQQGAAAGYTAAQVWEYITQVTKGALRGSGYTGLIYVPGYRYSGAPEYNVTHPNGAWITNGGNIRYEAHYYSDEYASGEAGVYTINGGTTNVTYAQELSYAQGLTPFP